MKNNVLTSIMIALGIIIAVGACCPIAFAKNLEEPKTLHEKIEKEIIATKNVKDAKVFLYENTALIALRTQNITNKTQTDDVKKEIKEFFIKKYPEYEKVVVTCSIKAFVAIERINDIIDAGDVDIDEFFDRIPSPIPRPIPKPVPWNTNPQE